MTHRASSSDRPDHDSRCQGTGYPAIVHNGQAPLQTGDPSMLYQQHPQTAYMWPHFNPTPMGGNAPPISANGPIFPPPFTPGADPAQNFYNFGLPMHLSTMPGHPVAPHRGPSDHTPFGSFPPTPTSVSTVPGALTGEAVFFPEPPASKDIHEHQLAQIASALKQQCGQFLPTTCRALIASVYQSEGHTTTPYPPMAFPPGGYYRVDSTGHSTHPHPTRPNDTLPDDSPPADHPPGLASIHTATGSSSGGLPDRYIAPPSAGMPPSMPPPSAQGLFEFIMQSGGEGPPNMAPPGSSAGNASSHQKNNSRAYGQHRRGSGGQRDT